MACDRLLNNVRVNHSGRSSCYAFSVSLPHDFGAHLLLPPGLRESIERYLEVALAIVLRRG